MRKIYLAILSFTCALLFSPVSFAQNTEEAKLNIYSKLKCCGCQVSFDKCACPEASQMKAYIEALLESGIAGEEIFYKVAKKFTLNAILDKKIKNDIEARLIQEAGEKRPQIALDSNSFDFGPMSKKKGKVSRVFRVSNKGSASLIIKQIKTSCPCATVSLKVGRNKSPYFGTGGSPKDWQAEIKAGEFAELDLMVDLASLHVRTGKLIRDATIISNDPIYPEVTVRVEAEVSD